MIDADVAAKRRAAALKAWETMRATGRTPHANRTPAPAKVRATATKTRRAAQPTVVLELIPARDTSNDDAEWAALEAAPRLRQWDRVEITPRPAGLALDRPHPLSYGADLPLRSELGGRKTKRWTLTAAERAHLAARGVSESAAPAPAAAAPCLIRPNAPHPQSEGAHLPLRGLKFVGPRGRHEWKLTAAEKATLVGRPIRYSGPPT